METTTAAAVLTRECPKCSGKGHIVGFEGIDNGRCWTCAGEGHLFTTAKREAARKSAAKRREAKAQAAAQAHVNAAITQAKANGMTLPEYHDTVCSCGDDCSRTWNDGAMGNDWDAA